MLMSATRMKGRNPQHLLSEDCLAGGAASGDTLDNLK